MVINTSEENTDTCSPLIPDPGGPKKPQYFILMKLVIKKGV